MTAVFALVLAGRNHVVTGEVLLPTAGEAPSAAIAGSGAPSTFVDAQIATIKSDQIIASSLDTLSLWHDRELEAGPDVAVAVAEGNSDGSRLQTISRVKNRLNISPFASGAAVKVTLASEDPDKAAQIVNAVLDAYVSDYKQATEQVPERAASELQQRLDVLQERAATAAQAASEARKSSASGERQRLEAAASTYRTLHEQTLHQYADALRAKPPAAGPRILARASAARASPAVSTATLAFGLLGGCALGLTFATRREQMLRPVRTVAGLEADSGLPVLGVISIVPGRKLYPKNGVEPPLLLHDDKDGLRSVLLRLREGCSTPSYVVGVASTLNDEGKSTLAFNLAVLGVEGGSKVLLLDGNLHRPALARGLTGDSSTELLSALNEPNDLVQRVVATEFGFDLLGEQSIGDDVRPAVLLASPGMDRLIASARATYDLIICDLPALASYADAQAAATSFDICVLVVEWGKTSTAALLRAVNASPSVGNRAAGIIINKAPPEVLRSA